MKDENTLLKAQVSASKTLPGPPAPSLTSQEDPRLKEYEGRIQGLLAEVTSLKEQLRVSQEGQKTAADELEKVRKDQDDLLELLADQVIVFFYSMWQRYLIHLYKNILHYFKLSLLEHGYTGWVS